MDVFLQIYLLVSVLFLFSQFNNSKNTIKSVIFFIVASMVILLSSFRSVDVGPDTIHYLSHFYFWSDYPISLSIFSIGGLEPGFILLNKVISRIGDDQLTFIMSTSIITLIPLFIWVYKKSINPLMSIYLFIALNQWYSTMVVIRMWLAIVILLYSFDYIVKRDLKRYIIAIFIAMLFHRTAIIALILYFIYPFKINKKLLLVFAISTIVLYSLGPIIWNFLASFSRSNDVMETRGGINLFIFLWSSVIFIYCITKGQFTNPHDKLFFLGLIIGATLQALALHGAVLTRLVKYFTVPCIVVLPSVYTVLLSKFREKWVCFVINLICIAIFGIFYMYEIKDLIYEFSKV